MTHLSAVRLSARVAALVLLTVLPVSAQGMSARDLYRAAQSRERDARAALDNPDAPPGETLAAVRSAVSAYNRVVLRFPRSSYCDNALWLAAQLSTDAYAQYGETRDRDAAERLLTSLVKEYPRSSMASLARLALPRIRTAESHAPATAPLTPAAVPPPLAARPPDTARLPEPPRDAGASVDAPAVLWSRSVEADADFSWPSIVAGQEPVPSMLPAAGSRLAGGPPYTVLVPGDVFAQQSVVQVVAASQFTTGDAARVGSQARVEPDLGIQVITPALHIGNLYADINVTRRDDRAIVGRAVMRLDGVRAAGLSWAVNAGDTWTAPVMPDFGFANLFAPPVTFQGVSINGSSPRTFLLIGGGRVTAQRNIFGTDTVAVGQNVYQGLFSHRQSDRLDILARGAYVQSEHVQGYSALTDRSVEGGAGFRFRPTPSLEIVGDGGVTRFRRTGSSTTEVGPTLLVGTLWSARRGWLQLNAQRFALGHYPVINYAYTDRAGVFASGEWDLSARTRAFGGAEHAITNLDPAASSQATTGLSPGAYTRAFGGLRVGLFESSIVSVRVEQGGRRMEPSRFSPGFQSDTGVVTAEWHGRFSGGNAFARYERRANVNPDEASSDFTQHDASGQVYFSLAGMRQVFAQVTLSRRADQTGTGQTLWLVGGGAQLPLGRLYFRVESTVSRMLEWSTQIVTPRQTLSTGISGQIANRTYLSVDCYLDHSRAADASVNPWVTRTMVRLTRAFPFGSARSPQMGEAIDGPTGRVTGIVFADWDGNGMMDTDEEVVSGISLSIGPVRSVTSAADGRFAFNRVPVGDQVVRVDLATLPADYDPPAEPERPVTVGRGQAAAVDFGLVPLGSFHGMVYQDVDGNGQLGPADTPIDGAVLVMDDGARTEVARQGRFTFDPVRMGTHTVNLLLASLPDGAQVAGSPTATVELGRNQMAEAVVFLVKVGKRQEIRKVFPPKK